MGKMPANLRISLWDEHKDFKQVFDKGMTFDVTTGTARCRYTSYVVMDVCNNSVEMARKDTLEKSQAIA